MKPTLILKVDPRIPERKAVEKAASLLRRGALVAFPTETVYGLGANLLNKSAMTSLRRVKARPKGKPFTVHIADTSIIRKMKCRITGPVKILIKKYWPGPVTIVLRSKTGKKIGFRMPAHKVALAVIKASRVPIVVPSANVSGQNPPKSAKEVKAALYGKIDLILDSGRAKVGVESTVVDMTASRPKVLREGAVPGLDIVKTLARGI